MLFEANLMYIQWFQSPDNPEEHVFILTPLLVGQLDICKVLRTQQKELPNFASAKWSAVVE